MIFLNILTIIGFVLLGIIALILLILLIILLWPFKYEIEADYHAKFKAKAVVSFLFHLLRVIFTFEDGKPLLVAKILWFKVYQYDFTDEEEEISEPEFISEPENIDEISGNEEKEVSDEASGEENPEEIPDEEFGPSKEEIDEFMAKELPPESPKSIIDEFFDNIENFFSKIKEKCYNLKRSIKEFQKKYRYYSKMVRYYYKVLHYKSMEPAFQMIKKTIIGILKHVRPRKVRVKIRYGADNPADTAKAVAIYSMIYPYYRKQIRLDAEFNESVFEGNLYIKGHFQLAVLAFYAVRAYLNKHVRKMIKLFTREGKKHG